MRRSLLLSLLLCASSAIPAHAGALTPYLVKDLNSAPNPLSSAPKDFVKLGTQTLFLAKDASGTRVWRSDGTAAGTYPVPGCEACESEVTLLFGSGSRAYFLAQEPEANAYSLWTTAGTRRSTRRLLTSDSISKRLYVVRFLPESGLLVFTFPDAQGTRQLWRTDGTVAGTFPLTHLAPSPDRDPTTYFANATLGRTLFVSFPAESGSDQALWKTDGTVAGTQVVRTFTRFDPPVSLFESGGSLYFLSDGLWRSDGTAAGTVRLREAAAIGGILPWNGKLAFVTYDNQTAQLAITDGTPAGTRLVTSFTNGMAFGPYLSLVAWTLGDRILFRADDGAHGDELWTTDGTAAGTRLVEDLCPGACSSAPYPLLSLPDGRVLLAATDGTRNGLWTTAGDPSDLHLVKAFQGVGFLAERSGAVLLVADDGIHGSEPWVSDGTVAGTKLLADLCPGSCGSLPFGATTLGERTLFTAGPTAFVSALVGTDGTPEGTAVLAAISDATPTRLPVPNLGGRSAAGPALHPAAGRDPRAAAANATAFDGAAVGAASLLLFAGTDRLHGLELWRTDGTPGGTALVADIDPRNGGASSSYPSFLHAAGDKLFFLADDGFVGGRLWTSDGTAAGTVPTDPPFLGGAFWGVAAALGDSLVFSRAEPNSANYRLWKSDGTPGGTVVLTPPGIEVRSRIVAVGGTLFFQTGAENFDLWKSDGTPEGTGSVGAIPTSSQLRMTAFAGRLLYFDGGELWSTDGTAAGTVRLSGFAVPELARLDGRLYFAAADEGFTSSLWSTDGTVAGTRQVVGLGTVRPVHVAVAGRKIYVFAHNPSTDMPVLVATDGTAAGTRRIAHVALAVAYDEEPPVDLGGRLFFRGNPQEFVLSGALWVSDGTVAGTKPFLDGAGHGIPDPTNLRAFAGSLVFTAFDATATRLWQSDGTAAGTRPLLTFRDPSFDTGKDLTVVGSRLFFSRSTPAKGVELWALRP